MSWFNIQDTPEKFGLTTVGTIERGGSYEFDTFVVWLQKDTGRVLYAQDAGCSCPTPFDDVGVDDTTEVTGATWGEFVDALKKHGSHGHYYDDGYDPENDPDITQLLAKVSPLVPREVAP